MASHSTDADAIPQRNSDDDETSRRSRARVSRACVRCRTRKDKCDGQHPECSNCTNAGQPCLYVAATKKRGLPEGYVRGLEKLWAVMLQKVDGLDNAVQQVVTEHEEELLRVWNHPKHGDELHTAWKESSVLGDLERLLSGMDHTPVDLKRKRDREDSDAAPAPSNSPGNSLALIPDFRVTSISADNQTVPTPQIFSSDRLVGQFPQLNANFRNAIQQRPSLPSPALANRSLGRHPDPPAEGGSLSSGIVPLPSSASGLLEQYFTYTHCWFPILDRPYILRKFYEHTRSRRSVHLDGGDLACMWAVCAYSLQQTKHLGAQAKQPSNIDVLVLRNRARELIPSESGPFTLGHVQAVLLLVLLDVGLGDWTSAWMLTGFAVRALLDSAESDALGQYSSGSTNYRTSLAIQGNDVGRNLETTKIKHQRWRAVLHGCFVMDTLISTRLGRPPHLRSSYLELYSPQSLEEDGHEEWEPWNLSARDMSTSREPAFVISCFNRLTELYMIVNDVISGGQSHVNPGTASPQELALRLHSLSERYCFDVLERGQRPPHQLLLQACHFTVEAILSRSDPQIQQQAIRQCREVLEIFNQSWNVPDKCGIPSVLIALCDSITSLFDRSSSWSHSTAVLWDSLSHMQSRMAIIWPGFPGSDDPGASNPVVARPPSLSTNTTESVSSTVLPMSPPGIIFQPTPNRRILSSITSNPGKSMDFAYQENPNYNGFLHQQQQTETRGNDYRPMSIDLSTQNQLAYSPEMVTQKDTGMGLGTSPSFNGDEIDALFHEMAQLDTTQWTMDRTQGLKDFGFADDSTFEAFCNDPDRLMLSDGYMGPAFNGGNLSASGQAPTMNAGGTQLGRMSFDDIFR